jgi:hypothetical protein
MQTLRRYHLYLGMFFAPAILLFALSGALQTFRLQEEKGWGSTPPGWIVWMASVHKDSRLPKAKPVQAGDHKPAPPKAAPKPPEGKPPFKLPMQIFAALLSIGLILSTLLGIVIALNNRALRKVSLGMLAAGTMLPLLLLML